MLDEELELEDDERLEEELELVEHAELDEELDDDIEEELLLLELELREELDELEDEELSTTVPPPKLSSVIPMVSHHIPRYPAAVISLSVLVPIAVHSPAPDL